MKILQVCPRYYPDIGGIEEHTRNISEYLAKRHDVTVSTTDPSGKLPKEENINGVNVVRFKSWAPAGSYFFSFGLKKYLKTNSNNFDLVHAHCYHAFPALYAAQTKTLNKLFFTAHYHGTGHSLLRASLHVPYKFYGKSIFEKADKVICVSAYERQLVLEKFQVSESKIKIIPNGINFEEFTALKRHEQNDTTILYVGRLEKYKGIHNLVHALTKLDNNTKLEIVGKGSFKNNLRQLVADLKLEKRVKFTQDLPRNILLQKYANSDLVVTLSEHEAYGICTAEALAAKTPCIVANTSALSEWIDNKNCFGVKYPIDLEELVLCIKLAIGQTVNKTGILDWSDIATQLSELYESEISTK